MTKVGAERLAKRITAAGWELAYVTEIAPDDWIVAAARDDLFPIMLLFTVSDWERLCFRLAPAPVLQRCPSCGNALESRF